MRKHPVWEGGCVETRRSAQSCILDTHSQHTFVQCSLFTSAERIARASLKNCSVIFVRLKRICHLVCTYLTFGSRTCLSPRAHHLPHSLFLPPPQQNTQHNRNNTIISKNNQDIMNFSRLSPSTSCGVLFRQGAQLVSGSAWACYPRHHGSRCKAARRAGRWERWRDRRWSEWRCRRGHSTCAWNMTMTMGWTRHKLESQCACIYQGRQSKDNDTNWQQKNKTTKTKDLQCMKTHALASTTLTLTCSPSVSGHFTHCWVSHCASCRQF